MCTVANSAFSASANITLKGISFFLANTFNGNLLLVPVPPNGVTAVQDGLTSITVTWTASSDATGYRVSYNSSEGDSGSADVSGNNHTLTGLVREATYTISIIATYPSLISSPIRVEVTLSEPNPTSIMSSLLFSNSISPTSRAGLCGSYCHNSHLHLPLLECGGWLSGQVRGGVERD